MITGDTEPFILRIISQANKFVASGPQLDDVARAVRIYAQLMIDLLGDAT